MSVTKRAVPSKNSCQKTAKKGASCCSLAARTREASGKLARLSTSYCSRPRPTCAAPEAALLLRASSRPDGRASPRLALSDEFHGPGMYPMWSWMSQPSRRLARASSRTRSSQHWSALSALREERSVSLRERRSDSHAIARLATDRIPMQSAPCSNLEAWNWCLHFTLKVVLKPAASNGREWASPQRSTSSRGVSFGKKACGQHLALDANSLVALG